MQLRVLMPSQNEQKTLPGYVLIDCPGTLNDPALLKVFQAADAAVIPFRYDDFMIDSTFTFTKVLMKEAPQAKKNLCAKHHQDGCQVCTPGLCNGNVQQSWRSYIPCKGWRCDSAIIQLYAQDQYQEAATAGAFNTIYEVVR